MAYPPSIQSIGRSGSGVYAQKVPVRTRVARWSPSPGCCRAIRSITARRRCVTAVRARSAVEPVGPVAPAEADRGRELLDKGVHLRARPLSVAGVMEPLCLGEVLTQLNQPASVGRFRRGIQ